jgi:TonB family protein
MTRPVSERQSTPHWILPLGLSLGTHGAAAASLAVVLFHAVPAAVLPGSGGPGSRVRLLAQLEDGGPRVVQAAAIRQAPAEAEDAGTGTGASPGTGGAGPPSSDAAMADYLAKVRQRIEAHAYYPVSLRRRAVEGTVQLSVTVTPATGELRRLELLQGSESPELDEQALEAVRAAAPFPVDPTLKDRVELTLRIPLEFRLD